MYKPLKDKVIVKPEQRFTSESLDLSMVAGAETTGYITAVGDDAAAHGLNVGDKVHFGTIADTYKDEYLKYHDFKENGERYLVMSWQDICFVEET